MSQLTYSPRIRYHIIPWFRQYGQTVTEHLILHHHIETVEHEITELRKLRDTLVRVKLEDGIAITDQDLVAAEAVRDLLKKRLAELKKASTSDARATWFDAVGRVRS